MLRNACTLLLIVWAHIGLTQDAYTLVFLHKKPDAEKIEKAQLDKLMEGHLANINRLAKEGHLLAAGPFEGGGGIFVFKSVNQKEVQELIQSDPAVRANRWRVEIVPYQPIVGSICPVGEKYEMTTYQFVRFVPSLAQFNDTDAMQLVAKHLAYWKEHHSASTLITLATLNKEAGDLLLAPKAIDEKILANDPGVLAGLYIPEVKMLWIARGSFCESK